MRTYTIPKISGEIDWTTIPVIPIDQILWSEDVGIRAQGQVCYQGDTLYLHQSAVEKEIRAEYTEPLSPVYEDSCLEFFFMQEGDQGYFNFEINPNGCIIAEYGSSGADRTGIVISDPVGFFEIKTDRTSDGWEVFYRIPLTLIQPYAPGFQFNGKLAANMYKCGDKTAHRHFLSWNPIDLEHPNFHCPRFFGTMNFGS